MARPRLHLDADTSSRSLQAALLKRGHDVTRTPNPWVTLAATDEQQLLGATANSRIVLTYNVKHYVGLVRPYPSHGGVVLAAQRGWTRGALIEALERMLTTTEADDWHGHVRWLNDWR